MPNSYPTYDIDLYSDDVIRNPYDHYRNIRDAGPAVWLPQHELWAIARYQDVRESLRNHRVFSSAHGVAANEPTNQASIGTTLASDPPLHDDLRRIIGAPLLPGALAALKERIEKTANDLVDRLVERKSFDAMADLARVLPVTIVSELVGVPEEGRQNMLKWAAATFDLLGVLNERGLGAVDCVNEMREYTKTKATSDTLRPGSWAAKLYEASDQGLVERERCPIMMRDYLAPSLDTTILGTGNIIWLLARHPEQWDLVREDPSLIPPTINEGLRLESPIRGFTRYLLADHQLGDVILPAGSRALILYAAANRDERKWEDPERFDVRRKASDHVAFGHGVHTCAGMHLARLEISSLLAALAKRVSRFELGQPTYAVNNVLRGFETLPVTVR